jgi:hypothetical protein
MAEPVAGETIDIDNLPPGWKILSNGAIHDGKRIRGNVGGKPTSAITKENSQEYHRLRHAAREAAVIEAANLVVNMDAENSKYPEIRALAGKEDAFIRAITMGRTKAAMDPDNARGPQSAEWVFREAGVSAKDSSRSVAEAENTALSALYALGAGAADQVLAWLQANAASRVEQADVVDAVLVTRTETAGSEG